MKHKSVDQHNINGLKPTFYQKYGKRFLDIVFSLVGLVVLSPFMLVIAIILKCTLKHDIIFSQYRPSMLISDPKGKLYSLHAKSLINRGYEVKILDLRNPYCSIRWNPLERPFEMYQEMLSLDDKVR